MTKYQMQAKSSANGQLYSWLADTPDWAAAGYVTAGHPGTAQDIAIAGGGIDNSSTLTSDDQVYSGADRVVIDTDHVVASPTLILSGTDRVMSGTDRIAI